MIAYRLLTGEDDAAFCHKVTQALADGWRLYGDPAYAFDAATGSMRCAQAVTKHGDGEYSADMKLGEL
ncbi:MAG: DUF1737 domain-containing protein [Pseudomonadota bacterium]